MNNIEWLKNQIWTEHELFEDQSVFVQKVRSESIKISDYADFLDALRCIAIEVEIGCKKYWDYEFEFVKDITEELSSISYATKKYEVRSIFASKFQLLGAIYAFLGSMKGGAVLVDVLSKNREFSNHHFYYYKARPHSLLWLQEELNHGQLSEAQNNDLISGVHMVFHELLDQNM